MPNQDQDISWGTLRQIVRDWAESNADLREFQPLHGGSVNTTLLLTLTDSRRAVLKITPHRVDHSYTDEAHQLNLIRECGVPVPRIYGCQIGSLDAPYSYLLMEHMEGVNLVTARSQCTPEEYDGLQANLAELLLRLHARTGPCFMRVSSTETPRYEQWANCYHDIFDPIWREVEKSGTLPVKARKTIGKVHDRLETLLGHDEAPRLVHWDVWATNVLARPDAEGNWRVSAIIDPNCKFADPEAELAYLELFNTATPAFFRAYGQARKLQPDYHRARKPIYQLYSLLNHARLFGQNYLKPLLGAIDRAAMLV